MPVRLRAPMHAGREGRARHARPRTGNHTHAWATLFPPRCYGRPSSAPLPLLALFPRYPTCRDAPTMPRLTHSPNVRRPRPAPLRPPPSSHGNLPLDHNQPQPTNPNRPPEQVLPRGRGPPRVALRPARRAMWVPRTRSFDHCDTSISPLHYQAPSEQTLNPSSSVLALFGPVRRAEWVRPGQWAMGMGWGLGL